MIADVHSHILFGIDDGAKSAEKSASILKELSENRVAYLALTPHYYPSQISMEDFLKKRNASFEAIKKLPEADGFSFSLGAEVYLSSALFNNEDLSPLCYEGTNRMLVELKYLDSFTESMRRDLIRLREDHDLIPVLAHIDRYPFFCRNRSVLSELRRIGCEFQVNFSAFFSYFERKNAFWLFDHGFLDYLGEDIHSELIPKKQREKCIQTICKKRKTLLSSANEKAISRLFLKG